MSFGVGDESTSLNMQSKSPMMARTKSKVAGSKKKTSKAATSTSEKPCASLGVEAMNRANEDIRQKTAVEYSTPLEWP